MNELDPALKRLLKWTREAPRSMPVEAPFGFGGRVLAAQRQSQVPTLLQELQRTAWSLICISLVLIICGGLLLVSQRSAPASAPAAELPSALGFLASNVTP